MYIKVSLNDIKICFNLPYGIVTKVAISDSISLRTLAHSKCSGIMTTDWTTLMKRHVDWKDTTQYQNELFWLAMRQCRHYSIGFI